MQTTGMQPPMCVLLLPASRKKLARVHSSCFSPLTCPLLLLFILLLNHYPVAANFSANKLYLFENLVPSWSKCGQQKQKWKWNYLRLLLSRQTVESPIGWRAEDEESWIEQISLKLQHPNLVLFSSLNSICEGGVRRCLVGLKRWPIKGEAE